MSTRTKTLGVAAAIAAIAVAVPTAYADPSPTPTPEPTPATAPAPVSPAGPVPTSTKVPDPQGSGCDAYRKLVPTGPGSIASMALQTGSEALASNPDLSTFSGLISGKLNPDVNIVNVLDGGPYVVFAPTNAAFAKLDPATLATLKSDPVVLLPTLFYHLVLGYLGPNDVQGKMPTQDGRTVNIVGKGSDVKVNDAKLVCAYTAHGAYIYMIDTVLTPPTPAAEAGTTSTSATATTSTSSTSATSTTAATSASETPATTSSAPASTTAASEPATTASATPTTTTAKPAA
ncbi:MAG: fasciclin domain-containing protein [Mycobacteriaceae bacterium]